MKRFRWWFLGAFVVVTALLIGVKLRARQNPLYQLSRYPRTPAFNLYLFGLSQEMNSPIPAGIREPLIEIDEPAKAGFEKVSQLQILQNGDFSVYYNSPSNSRMNSGWRLTLSSDQLDTVKGLRLQLPPDSPPVKRDDLLIVRVHGTQPMQLRLYDKNHPPPQISEIKRMIYSYLSP